MKILIINVCCGTGSTGRICTDLADMLIEQGHECKIAYGRDDVPEKYRDIAVKIGSSFSIYCNALKARLFDNEGFNATKATKKFIKWVEKYDPDVIHLHNLHGYYLNVKVLFDYLRTCGKKIVWTLHDCWAFTGHCTHFQSPHCDSWKTECGRCVRMNDYPKALTDRSKRNFLLKKELFTGIPNLTIVTPSKWLAELVKQSFLNEYPVRVINNGIDLTVFKPTKSDFREKYGLIGKKIILGVASVWDARKGLNDFIKLADLIDSDTRIVLVGVNKKQKKHLPKNIVAIEKTNNAKELAEIYTAADVFFNPSVEETFGMTAVEAMACGTYTIVYDHTAVAEIIPVGYGEVVKSGNAEAVALKINTIKRILFKEKFQYYNKKEKSFCYMNLYFEKRVL